MKIGQKGHEGERHKGKSCFVPIPNHNIVRKLGEGPQSVVYKAYHRKRPDRLLTLKILKAVSLSEDQKRRFRQKIEHLKVLHDISVITPLAFTVTGDALFFTRDYFKGTALDDWTRKQTRVVLTDFFKIACKLAEILDKVHEAGIVHGGIKPHNILIHTKNLDVRLIDFIATLDVRDVSHFIYDRGFLESTLAYTSPEQTGRINHRVGFSTDIYSLGTVFYELLTGRPPFFSTDPLELIHSHLAEEAQPVSMLNPEIPSVLSKIIAKLILKQPEKRYQSASGLLADLVRCRDEYSATGTICEFPIGVHDRTHGITFVSRMVGRGRETATILAEYDKAACGAFRGIFISGRPGIGKTRLIQELQKPIVEHRGYFASGKFDVHQKNIPYSSLIQAFRNLVRTFLTESDERNALWRQRIIKALGPNGKVVTDVIPELSILIGLQQEVRPLPPVESKNRFQDVFGCFLTSLASEENPLVLFIDDLQWCDSASFDFLAHIFANYEEHPYLLFVGAYRHNNVDSTHPLTELMRGIRKKGQLTKEIRLKPLEPKHCHEMVSYILDSPLSQTRDLASFVTRLTEGNPLFVSEILSYFYNQHLLTLDENRHWQWEMDKITKSDMPSTVAALFGSKVQKLPPDTIDLLEYCACLGNRFTPDRAALIKEITLFDTFEGLKPVLGQGLLVEDKDRLQFVHDRVQEAVLDAIQPARRRQIHWRIGRRLLVAVPQGTDLEKLDTLFTIASYLNTGKEKEIGVETACELSDINYHAGNKALNSLATDAANQYFRLSLELLSNECREIRYNRTFETYQKLAKTELMCGRYDRSEKLLNQLLDHARTDLDRAEALAEQTTSLSSVGNFIKAIETANRGLAFFGKSIPKNPELAEKKRDELMGELNSGYTGKIWDIILNMPFTEKRKNKIELAFYSELIPDLYMSGMVPQLYLSAVQSTQHCLEGGMDESVIYSFSIMALYLGEQGEFEQAFRYEDLARDLCEKHPNTFGATRGMNGVVWCNMHSRSHPQKIVKYCLKAIRCGRNCGDLYNAGLAYGPLMWNQQVQGADLVAVEESASECLEFSRKYRLSFSVALAEGMQAAWIEPMKREYRPVPMEAKIRRWKKDNHIAAAGSYYVHKALSHYYLGEYEQAEECLVEVRQYLKGLTDNVLKRQWRVFRVLNAIRLHEMGIAYKTREELLSFVQPIIEIIETWTGLGPLLRPYLAFIHAELEKTTGEFRKARSLYFDAIAIAHKQQYTLLEGHINECRGELLKKANIGTAGVYLHEAARLYTKCHARRKKILLMERYPDHFEEKVLPVLPLEAESPAYTLPSLDVDYLMKSCLAISAEIHLDILLNKIMNVVLEASGAQRGYLLIEENGALVVRAENHISKKDLVRTVRCNLEDASDVCKAIVRYVHRTKERVILDNASQQGDFRDNPEVQAMQLRSVLCLPLIEQSKLIGIIYLENRLSDLVFTAEKTRTTELLASQAAISLENARLLSETRKAREDVKESLKEKEVLLKEIHHRVKNNLQVIYSLLRLQSAHIKNEYDSEIFRESRNRIRSMALIHEKLYQSKDLARINFAEYTKHLATNLLVSYAADPEAVTLDIKIENIFLGIDVAIPCGLIINELVSNCLKHAFPEGRKGKISILLCFDKDPVVREAFAQPGPSRTQTAPPAASGNSPKQGDNRLTLIVMDDGVGFPDDIAFFDTETLGLQLVMTLVKQLKGTINFDRRGGTRVEIGLAPIETKKKQK